MPVTRHTDKYRSIFDNNTSIFINITNTFDLKTRVSAKNFATFQETRTFSEQFSKYSIATDLLFLFRVGLFGMENRMHISKIL